MLPDQALLARLLEIESGVKKRVKDLRPHGPSRKKQNNNKKNTPTL